MQDKLIITGISPYDGEYDFDILELIGSLTNRELHRVKLMSGIRAGELFDSLKAGDTDLIIALAVVELTRRGRRVDEDAFWDAPALGGVTLDIAEREDDEDPPAEAAIGDTDSPKPNGGESSKEPSDKDQASSPSPTGRRASPRSAT